MQSAERIKSLGHVVITGGCGFLGHHLVQHIQQYHPKTQISVLDLRTLHNNFSSESTKYFDADITDLNSLRDLFEELKPDVVIHTASPHLDAPRAVLQKVNIEGTENLLKCAAEVGTKAFVYTSSASVVMEGGDLKNVDERWPVITGKDQPEFYAHTKGIAEQTVLRANRSKEHPQFLTCAIRPAGIFGEGDVQVIPGILGALKRGQYKAQLGSNDNLFDFTYVGNIAYAHLLAAGALLSTHAILPSIPLDMERVDGEAYFITNDTPVYFWDFARAVWKAAGASDAMLDPKKVWVLHADFAMFIGNAMEWVYWGLRKGAPSLTWQKAKFSTINRYHNVGKAKKRLGYDPIVDLEEGIKRGVQSVLEREGWKMGPGGVVEVKKKQ
ncbi:sterol-4-alpha-carboxylate 3-dehydrogenase [Aulographum hederae CBS 113979]|uniref:Sterol-4-alpha-carboxylate 3-dehydrogenase ERG26, decarboxylating n=1 Tax=Aulographum hederae CBS 113979 TaxID=1176131 RepID=A0A6G1HGF3_9PEZI|nr:sterol-4-alpha-carboxylate 3-dehydrogenase [Aulographum hederae CBS 113979]